MAAKAMQVSIDSELLDLIDTVPEVRQRGRSAFISAAVRLYPQATDQPGIDGRLAGAYTGQEDAPRAEIEPLIGRQAWSSD